MRRVENENGKVFYETPMGLMTEAEFDKAFGPRQYQNQRPARIKPKLSDALGVRSKNRQAAMDDAKKRGVPTDFAPDGRAIILSRAHQKAYCKAYGYVNRDGGYGD